MVNEPDTESAISILRGIKEKYETHHKVRIKDEAIIGAVELSTRYITNRFLPDKAIDLMDEAAAKLRMEINSKPEELDVLDRKIMQLEIEIEAIKREKDETKLKSLRSDLANIKEQRNEINAWLGELETALAAKQEKTAEIYEPDQTHFGVVRDAEICAASHKKSTSEILSEVSAGNFSTVLAYRGYPASMIPLNVEQYTDAMNQWHKRCLARQLPPVWVLQTGNPPTSRCIDA